MESNRKKRLNKKQVQFLENIPEHGMGYHRVDLEMRDGKKLYDRVILNSCFLLLDKDEEIDISKIKLIKPRDENSVR
jgi:hypothetical protein